MLKLKDFFDSADENALCKIVDINGKVLLDNKSVYEITELYEQFFDYHIINFSVMQNWLYIIIDVDFKN